MSETAWVFGYGSLMWNPGFVHLRAVKAVAHGVHRALCVHSTHYRGTQEAPGLVFGLNRGGSCLGLAYEVGSADWPEVRDYLRKREQVTMVYREVLRPVRLVGEDRVVTALTYVADPAHPQYAGILSEAETLAIVARCAGLAGPNRDYVLSTADHLATLGIRDRSVERLATALRAAAATP